MNETSTPALCPRCGSSNISVVSDRRVDAMGELEKHTVTCSEGHIDVIEDQSGPGAMRAALGTAWQNLTRP